MSTIISTSPAATALAVDNIGKNESSPSSPLASLLMKGQESPESSPSITTPLLKATDETLSTVNCDDSFSTSANMTQVRLYEALPPVVAVNVDRRSVRQRLRDQEAKINALLNKPTTTESTAAAEDSSSGEVLLKLVQTLEADLKRAHDEKEELQSALSSLQATVEDENSQEEEKQEAVVDPKGEAAVANNAIRIEHDAMVERISQLEMRLKRKTNETYLLQDRWDSTIRKMVQYQVDLETHDLHFTDYATSQFQLGDEALQELRGLTQKDQPPASRQLGKKAKQMLSTLLRDLENLGERYKDSRANQEQQVVDLRIAQIEWQRRAEHLEAICEQHEIDIGEDATTTTNKKLRLHQSSNPENQADLKSQVKASQHQSEAATLECDVLKKEVERLRQTVSKLQNATKEQEEAIYKAQQQAVAEREAAAAAVAAAQPPVKQKKKKKGWFTKQKKTPTTQSPPATAPPAPLPVPIRVDVAAALAPMDGESKRFDMLHERMQAQGNTIKCLHQDYQRVTRQKTQLQETVTELREQQERDNAVKENDVLHHMQLKMDQLEARRAQEQEQAQATIDQLRAQLAAMETKNASSSEDGVYFI